MGAFGTHDPKKIAVVFNGYLLTGFGEDTMVSVEPGSERVRKWVGATGNVIFVFSADKSATITVTLDHTSPDNAQMVAFLEANVIGPVEVKDNNTGRVLGRGDKAAVEKLANLSRGAQVTTNDWTILVAELLTEG